MARYLTIDGSHRSYRHADSDAEAEAHFARLGRNSPSLLSRGGAPVWRVDPTGELVAVNAEAKQRARMRLVGDVLVPATEFASRVPRRLTAAEIFGRFGWGE